MTDNKNKSRILHVITDPFCGWCYAAAPLLDIAKNKFTVILHGGGLLTGEKRCFMSPKMRDYVLMHDKKINELTGQVFTDAYINGILKDSSFFMDSTIPIAAINAAQSLAIDTVAMQSAIQIDYYQQGKSPCDIDNLTQLAESLGAHRDAFSLAFAKTLKNVDKHIYESRKLLVKIGGQGFPTMALEEYPESYTLLDHQKYYGKAPLWQDYLSHL